MSVNRGLKINDVVCVKRDSWLLMTSKGINYVIKELCNGIASIEDTNGILYFGFVEGLIHIGHVEKCIQFKDKSLCLI